MQGESINWGQVQFSTIVPELRERKQLPEWAYLAAEEFAKYKFPSGGCHIRANGIATCEQETTTAMLAAMMVEMRKRLGSASDVIVPGDSVASAQLILREAALILKGYAEHLQKTTDPQDWKAQTTAAMTMDQVKKLAWVNDLLGGKPPETPALPNKTMP